MNRSGSECLRCLVIFMMLGVTACAKISTPSGGLRDRQPPIVMESNPPNGSKNFKSKKIEITFDEFVVLDNINDKFMVSPPMQKKPRVFIRGKNVNIEYDEALRDSTTYTLYFLDAIRDLNEGNILDNYKFVFSTGDVIDSLSVTGNVYNSLTLEVPEKSIVLLYKSPDDSAVIKKLPDYLSRVDPTGYFRIDNVREGKYRLYSLKDDDNSKNYNRLEESFAFMDSLISVTPENNFIPVIKDTVPKAIKKPVKTTAPVKGTTTAAKGTTAKIPEPPVLKGEFGLIQFAAQKKDHYLTKSAREPKYKLTYMLSLPPDSMKFEFSIPDISSDKYLIEQTRYRDTITVWLTDSVLYSQPLISTIVRYPFTDTLKVTGYKQDTIPMRFIAPRAPRVAKVVKPKLTLGNNITGGLKPGAKIVFTSQTPLLEPDTTKIRLYEIIEKARSNIAYQFNKDSTIAERYILDANLIQGKQYLFVADSAAFSDIYDYKTDSIGVRFSVREAESFSKLTLNITNCGGNCIIQLLNNTEKLVAEKYIKNDGKVEFPLLEKGQYRIRAIYDLDGDGKWTTGDFMKHRQPEPVSFYPEEINLPENFYANQDWNLKDRNLKDQKLRQKAKTR